MSAIRGDIIHTIIYQSVVAAAQFLQYRIVSDYWGIQSLSAYTLIYRVRSAMEWIVIIALPLAIARMMSAERAPHAKAKFAVTGFAGGMLLYFMVALLLLVSPARSAQVLFGRAEYDIWVLPFCSLLGAYCTFMLAAGVLRGMFAFRAANLSNVVSIAVVPTACLFCLRGHDIREVIVWMSAASVLATIAALALVISYSRSSTLLRESVSGQGIALGELKSLLAFGAPRLLTLGLSAAFTVCLPWLVSSGGDAELLANLNVVLALLGAAAMITSPAGFVLLPHFSRSLAVGDREQAAAQLKVVLSAAVFVGVAASLLAFVLIPLAMSLLLGQMRTAYLPLVAAVAVALPFFMIFDVLRSPLDALSRAPLNALTYLAGLLGTFTGYVVAAYVLELPAVGCVAVALVVGNMCAAGACLMCAVRGFGEALVCRRDLCLVATWFSALIAWILVSGAEWAGGAANATFAASGLICCGLYLWRVRPSWLGIMLRGIA